MKRTTGERYGVAIIDPPYRNFSVERYYPTMSNEDILTMMAAVRPLLAPDAMVWMWVANGNILFGSELLAALGARHSSMITWIKPRIGRGRPLRSSTEHVLLGVVGKPVVSFRGQGTWFFAPQQDPSHKPEELHIIAERLSPGPYLELFARRPRPGWSVWGGQLPHSDVVIEGYPVPGESDASTRGAA